MFAKPLTDINEILEDHSILVFPVEYTLNYSKITRKIQDEVQYCNK